MKRSSLFSLLLLTFAGSAVAQACPDLGIINRQQELQAGPSTHCGIGLEITIGGVTYTHEQGFCPSFVVIIPEHGVPAIARKGYRYLFAGVKDVHMQNYECYGWFWTACRTNGSGKTIYAVDNYRDNPCQELSPEQSPLTPGF